jgi:hypothetical protein
MEQDMDVTMHENKAYESDDVADGTRKKYPLRNPVYRIFRPELTRLSALKSLHLLIRRVIHFHLAVQKIKRKIKRKRKRKRKNEHLESDLNSTP